MKKLGFKIKKLRELRNFTQSYMAQALGITQSTYCRYEHDELIIDEEMLQKISIILSISPNAILAFEEEKLFQFVESLGQNHSPVNVQIYETLIDKICEDNRTLRAQLLELVTLIRSQSQT